MTSFLINNRAEDFAKHIVSHWEGIENILLEYESYEVVVDETERTLDLFQNLHENEQYFAFRINDVAAFLPRNQPLYAFSCFVIIPSLMAHKVYFRMPHSMRGFFEQLLLILKVADFFPNIIVLKKGTHCIFPPRLVFFFTNRMN